MLRRSDQLPIVSFSAPRLPPTASPLPLLSPSRAGAGRQPFPVPGHGPARRDVTSRVTASRWGDVTRRRDHRPPALQPGPLPNRCPLFGVRRCAWAGQWAPTEVCQGLTCKGPDPVLSQIRLFHGNAGSNLRGALAARACSAVYHGSCLSVEELRSRV